MTVANYVTALTSCMDTDEGFKRLYYALAQMDEENLHKENIKQTQAK